MRTLTVKEYAIERCLEARNKAVLIKSSSTKVGACAYTKLGFLFEGYNIQNKCHKSYHAEEIAILNCILQSMNPKGLQGIIVSFSKNDIKRLTFCCGHCRQVLWEYTRNPNLLITEIDLMGSIVKEMKLGELYQYPYPR